MVKFSKYVVMFILFSKVVDLGITNNFITKLCPFNNNNNNSN